MRQKSKRFILMLCVAVCLCFLAACGSRNNDSARSIDASLADSISRLSEQMLEEICLIDKESAPLLEESLRDQRLSVLADGIADWASVSDDTGDFVSAISAQVVMEDADTYICTVYAQFEKRDLEFKMYYAYNYDSQTIEATSITFNPEYTLGEKMQKALLNMIMGMGLVFVILIFLCLVISCFRFIPVICDRFKGMSGLPEGTGSSMAHADTSVVRRNPASKSEGTPAEAGSMTENEIPVVQEEILTDDLELVAVIAAAIAASEDIPADGLKVRSIRRLSGSKWKNQ